MERIVANFHLQSSLVLWQLIYFKMMNTRNEEINAKKIKAVKDATYTVGKEKHEKSLACGYYH